jgi:glycosyltransferase involved in cell wall biosynthesis
VRIAHVVESLYRGGLERMVCDLAAAQSADACRVSVICLFHTGVLGAELGAAGIPVQEIGKRSGHDVAAVWRLRRALHRFEPDVVHTHNAVAHYHTAAACWGSRIGPLVNTRHGMGSERESRVERRFRRSLSRTARVVAVSGFSGAHLVGKEMVPERLLRVIPNGIRVERFGRVSRQSARVRLNLPPESLVIGTVGRLTWAKDQALLVSAIAALAPRFPLLRATVVGDGPLRTDLEQQISALGLADRITLCGDRSDVPDILPAFDIFALPSRTEGYSIALLEAAASGVPAVVADVGGNREIVQDGRTGLVARGDFAPALARLLDDIDLRQRMGAAAGTWALEHASVESMNRLYSELYRSVAPRGSSSGEQQSRSIGDTHP